MQDRIIVNINHYFERALAIARHGVFDKSAVHDFRVLCKKIRGLLRLYRDTYPEMKGQAITLSKAVSAMARQCAGSRDAQALLDLLNTFSPSRSTEVAVAIERLKSVFEQQLQTLPDIDASGIYQELLNAEQLWQSFSCQIAPRDLRMALNKSMKKTQDEGDAALLSGDAHALHEWRKRVKYQYYQLDIVTPSPRVKTRYKQLKKMGALLGEIHDFDELNDFIEQQASELQALLPLIQKRRRQALEKTQAIYIKTRMTREQRQKWLLALG